MKTIVKDNKYSEVAYYPEHRLGTVVWKMKVTPSEEYRATYKAMLEFGLKQQSNKKSLVYFLADTSMQGVVLPSDRKWFQEYMLPHAIKTGIVKGAVIISGGVFKQYYINLIIKTVKSFDMPFKVFKDFDSAVKWLISTGEYLKTND